MKHLEKMSPEEKIRNLPGRLIGLFLIAAGLVVWFANYLLVVWTERYIAGGRSIAFIAFILGIGVLLITPSSVTFGDFMKDQVGFFKKIYLQKNIALRLLWVLIWLICIAGFFYFLRDSY